MSLPRFTVRLWKGVRSRRADRLRGLHDPQRLRDILRRERDRSDRTGDPLALLTFTPREPETREETFDRVAAFLKGRLRSTDDAGWLSGDVIAAVLPHTPASGAWKVADDVCLAFGDECLPPLCNVYGYPSRSGSDGERRAAGAGGNGEGQREEARPVSSLELIFLQRTPLWKRSLDVIGALAALVLLSPLFVLIGAAIKLTSRGPVFYKQQRDGLGGRPFCLYKFRSMVADADERKREVSHLNHQDGPAFKIEDDPRTTWVGRFLRATSFDELPQLWNVLRGEMSLVGPRPLPCQESAACTLWQRRRLDVVPGLTCTWQIRGRSRVSFDQWMRMDLDYIRRRSLLVDLRLLVQTVPAVLLGRGM